MKTLFPILGVVLTILLALSISSCDEEMNGQIEPVVDAVVDTPPADTVSLPSEPMVPSSGGITVSITPAQIASPAVGAQLTIRIDIARAMNVAGYDIRVGFDPTALRYIEGVNADYLPTDESFPGTVVASTNSVRLVDISLVGPAAAESGTLATVTFEVVDAKASALQLMDVIISDSAATSLSVTTQNGTVTAP